MTTINTIDDSRLLEDDLTRLQKFLLDTRRAMANVPDGDEDLRDIIRTKAARHRQYYESLVGSDTAPGEVSAGSREMAPPVSENSELCDVNKRGSPSPEPTEDDNAGGKRQRRQGVYELARVVDDDATIFKSVKQLRENYLAMLEKTSRNLALTGKEAAEKDKFDHLVPPPSGYCSSSASGGSDDEREKTWPHKNTVRRCGSSDSAVHSDEDAPVVSNWGEKKEEYNLGEGKCKTIFLFVIWVQELYFLPPPQH